MLMTTKMKQRPPTRRVWVQHVETPPRARLHRPCSCAVVGAVVTTTVVVVRMIVVVRMVVVDLSSVKEC
jgi:hypothetical protein